MAGKYFSDAVHIFTDFGNATDLDHFPFYINTGITTSTVTVQIPGSFPLGNHQAVAVATFQARSITIYGDVWLDEPPLVVQGTIPVRSPLGIALSTILSGLIEYWGPVLTIYLTTVTLLWYLVAECDRKKQNALRKHDERASATLST